MSWDGNLMAPAVSSRSIDPLRFFHQLCCRIARLFFSRSLSSTLMSHRTSFFFLGLFHQLSCRILLLLLCLFHLLCCCVTFSYVAVDLQHSRPKTQNINKQGLLSSFLCHGLRLQWRTLNCKMVLDFPCIVLVRVLLPSAA